MRSNGQPDRRVPSSNKPVRGTPNCARKWSHCCQAHNRRTVSGNRPWKKCPRAGRDAPASFVGQQLGHYQILSLLGEGGMGIVYKARDQHLDRFVAIKVLPPELVADPDRKRRFVQEAKAASALNHPNIITIHDIASDNGTDFIVMEYVQGKTLGQLIPRRGLKLTTS